MISLSQLGYNYIRNYNCLFDLALQDAPILCASLFGVFCGGARLAVFRFIESIIPLNVSGAIWCLFYPVGPEGGDKLNVLFTGVHLTAVIVW